MWKFLLILLNFITFTSCFVRPNVEIASRAIASLVDIMYYEYSMKIKLIVREDEEMFDRIADKTLKYSSSPLQIARLGKNEKVWYSDMHVQYSYLVLSNNLTGSDPIFDRIKYKSNLYVRIFYHNDKKGMEQKYVRGYSDTPHYQYSILPADKNQSLFLYGNVMYQRRICTTNWNPVSFYDHKKRKWSVRRFIPENKSFNKCPLKVGIQPVSNKYLNYQKNEKGNLTVAGVYASLLELFAKKYNIRIDYHLGCSSEYEMCLSGESTELVGTRFVQTSPLVVDHVTFMTTRGDQYTPFEKLLLPFDLETWIYVIIAFIGGYFSIFIIYLFPKFIQDLFFGKNNKEPTLSLTRTFFGDGLTREPTENFPRIIFMSFTLYCLLIRTAYQSKMFDFLHSETEKWTPDTMEDLVKHQIKIVKNMDNMKLGYGVEDHL